MDFKYLSLLCVLSLLVLFEYAETAKILAIFVFPGKSHFMMTKALIKELTKRGHEVTFLTSFSMGEKLNNYKEILVDPPYNFWQDVQQHFKANTIFDLTDLNIVGYMKLLEIIGLKTTEHALNQPRIQEIINATETKNKYDLLLAEQFYQEAFLPLAVKYDIPVITACTFGYGNFMSQMMGYITPWSIVPHAFIPIDDKMSFWERITNVMSCLYEDYFREIIYFPLQDNLVEKYFSHLPIDIPKVTKLEKNVSLILLNSYVPLNTPRPAVPGMIPVGGLHIQKPKQLPKDIQEFLDGAKDGAIYFSLGTNVRSADLPPEKLAIFLQVFGSLKQRILWKWEDDEMPKLPSNVMIKKWMPQNDILAHPNIKIFITHGGLMGTQEGVHHGVPMLGIPIYCDQYLNMNKAAKSGYGISINFQSFTKDDLENGLNKLLFNPYYKEHAKRISQIFRDRPQSAIDTAMYWIEYVIRYKGAPQLRSAGTDLPWYSFYLLDVIAVFLAIAFSCVILMVCLFRKLFYKKSDKKKIQ